MVIFLNVVVKMWYYKKMKYPNFRQEKKLYKKGYKAVVGIDEAGRGPLAGPVVACAFRFKKLPESGTLDVLVKDSKQLSAKQREEIYDLLKKDSNIKWGIGRVYPKLIDKINILNATKLAMKRAVENLKKEADFLLIDGNFGLNLDIPQKFIIKGDQKVFSIATASIIAKVTRDRTMANYCKKYPEYCFGQHKGYPTKQHKKLIKQHGICQLHRKTFKIS